MKDQPVREQIVALARQIHREEIRCSCDPKYLRSCPRYADAVFTAARRIKEQS